MKIFKEAKDKGKAPSKVKGKREKIKRRCKRENTFTFGLKRKTFIHD